MKIIQLYAENIKRLNNVTITPTENCIIISGKNENGKSSLLDSIWLALQYRTAIKSNPQPLRKGATNGVIEVDIGDYIVTRKFTENDSTLEIKKPDGSKIPSPQKFLDGLIGDLSFDPWEFSRKTELEQRQVLSDLLFTLTGGAVDLTSFDTRRKELYDERTELNRDKKRLEAVVSSLGTTSSVDPATEVDIVDVKNQILKAIENNQNIAKDTADADRIKNSIAQLQVELAATELRLKNANIIDIAPLETQIKEAEKINKRYREVLEIKKISSELGQINCDIDTLNNKIELLDIEKQEALESANLPIKDIGITADGITIKGNNGEEIPYCQASSAKRLKVSTALAMAINPKLRVIRVADGSLLDDDSMAILKEMADKHDFQIWLEFASRNDLDRIGIYIEDGFVK